MRMDQQIVFEIETETDRADLRSMPWKRYETGKKCANFVRQTRVPPPEIF